MNIGETFLYDTMFRGKGTNGEFTHVCLKAVFDHEKDYYGE